MQTQTSPLFGEIKDIPKMIQSWPEEVQVKMFWAYESAYHEGVAPRGGVFKVSIPRADQISKGDSRADEGVGQGINADASLAVRWWRSDPQAVDPVYRTPVGSQFEAPRVTMGVLKFTDAGDRDLIALPNGQQVSKTARLFVPVWHHMLNEYQDPLEGDLVEFWAGSWHELGTFYDVIKVSKHGYISNSSHHVMWELSLQQKSEFRPERRLLGKRGEP